MLIAIISSNKNSEETVSITHDKGKKIAYVQNNEYHFIIDTTKYKANLNNMVSFVENANYDEVKIEKGVTLGNLDKEYYMLIAYDKEYYLKTARWLIKDKDTLYLHRNTGKNIDNEIFYRTFFSVYGSNTNCYPNVVCAEGKYQWTGDTTGKPYCEPDSPCKSSSIFFPYE